MAGGGRARRGLAAREEDGEAAAEGGVGGGGGHRSCDGAARLRGPCVRRGRQRAVVGGVRQPETAKEAAGARVRGCGRRRWLDGSGGTDAGSRGPRRRRPAGDTWRLPVRQAVAVDASGSVRTCPAAAEI